MSVGREEVRRIAELARLRFGDEELERLTAELNGILEHVRALEDPGHVPSGAAADATQEAAPAQGEPSRGTEATPIHAKVPNRSAQAPDGLAFGPAAMAPRWRDGFFVVPPPPGVQAGEKG